MESKQPPLLLRPTEVAEQLGISRALAYKWIKDGILPTIRRGKAVRVPRGALLKWIEEETQNGATAAR